MTALPGYLLETLSQDGELVLLRAVPEQKGPLSRALLLLAPAAEIPGAASIARLEHVWNLRDQLDPSWAARPHALEHDHGRPLLLLEDPGGEPLSRLVGRRLELAALLRIAIGVAVAIGQLHRQGLVHKDLKPTNLLVDALTGHAWLADLSIASPLPRERKSPESVQLISGTLAYMAPEQTGRMNRSIDSRSDLYSLGITFYELLTGLLPFSASDPMGWVHCHVAREPPPLTAQWDGEQIPPGLSAVVRKLLAKAPEDRYQTAAGLELDLRRCLLEWQECAQIEPFPLGARDTSDRLRLPEKLYGREREVGALRAAFERVLARGNTELVLVSGYSGVGKSSIVSELHRMPMATRALFAMGKCDELKRDVPYGTLAQSFQGVVREVLGKNEAEVRSWRDALREALGSSGQLMVSLIPELELIIGEQPALPDLPAREAQTRFQLVFQRFIAAVARPEHPLVLFFDDLQWLDMATLEIVEWLVTGPDAGSLLLVGAYRDNEVHASHPLQRMLDLLRGSEGSICELVLEPLAQQDVSHLIQETLVCSRERAEPLTELVYRKTAGNPFFTIQFIAELAEEELLIFDPSLARWSWDLARIRTKNFSDNVAALMISKLSRLPEQTRTSLARLACLGSVGDTATLALVLDEPDDVIHARLWDALRLGLIFREGTTYSFLHDRVYEAAYSLIPEGERAAEHLKIGRLLASRTAREEEEVFGIVSHFNRGAALLESPEERERVAGLNLVAGRRARASTAHGSALSYCSLGRSLLDEASWVTQYDLTFALELHIAECEFLTGNLPAAQERLSALSDRAMNTLDHAAVTRLHMALYTTLGRTDRAIETGLAFLSHLGFDWSPESTDEKVSAELARMRELIAGRPIADLIDLPLMSDLECLATVDVLAEFLAPASFAHRGLFDLALLRTTNLSLIHGNCAASPFAFALLNIVLGLDHGDYQTGLSFGQLGCDLVDKRGLDRFKARVYNSFATFVLPWTRHLPLSRPILRRALDATTATGDLTFEAYTRRSLVSNMMVSGERLEDVQRETEQALAFARKAKFGFAADSFVALLILIRDVRGSTEDDGLSGELGQDEHSFERHLNDGGARLAVAASRYWIGKVQARFFTGDYAGAIAAATKASDLLWASRPFVEIVEYHFYAALSLAGAYDSAPAEQRLQRLAAINAHREHIASRAEGCPENWGHRATLIGAELARIEGRDADAMRLYEEAILSARDQGFTQNEGVCSELAAKFYEARRIQTAAHSYWRNARACYERWGAMGKVRRLDEAQLRPREGSAIAAPVVAPTTGQLDMSAVVKMSQAVSGEIVLDRLIEKLMVIAVEHAGAVRGLLFLQRGAELKIEAEATTSHDGVEVCLGQVSEPSSKLPESILRYVMRSQESVIVDDALAQNPFSTDDYIQLQHPRSILCLPLIKQGRLIGALYLENSLSPNVFTPARMTVLQVLASQAAISLENARLYGELRESDAYLAEAQRLSHTGSFGWNVETGELHWSDETFRIYGLDSSLKPTIDLLAQRTHPDDRANATEELQSAVHRELDWELEYRLLMPDGSIKNLRLVARAVRENAKHLAYLGAVMDVTAAKRAERGLQTSLSEKQALLKEVHHRVKNNLQLLSSLLSLQAERTKDQAVMELFADSRNRVRSMALVHENLYRAGDFGKVEMAPHIQNLCAHLTRVYAVCDRPIDLIVQISDCHMDLDRAVSCGLLVNELVSNALKHAFPDGRRGHVCVELRSSPGGLHELVVSDDGVGLAPDVTVTRGESLGLQLVGDLTKQLRGNIKVDRASGTKFSIAFGSLSPAAGAS